MVQQLGMPLMEERMEILQMLLINRNITKLYKATEWIPFVSWHDGGGANGNTLYANINFGNHSFLGTVPTGFTTLSSSALIPRAKIYKPQKHFDIITYTGDQTNGTRSITGLEFTRFSLVKM